MTNPTCLIIGGAGGIGRELAATLHARGWNLILAGRTLSSLEPLAAEFGATVRALDASDFAAVESLFADHPSITAAANLAGSILLKPAHLTSEAEFAETISQNLKTAFALTRAAGRKGTQGVHYFTDAAPLAAGGTPSVVFGPGDIAQAHTEREWLAISQLEKSIQILERFLRALD